MVHDFTGRPSIRIVQAPQWVVSHPIWVPVSRSVSRSMWTSKSRGSTSAWCFSPLIESFTSMSALLLGHRPALPPGAFEGLAKRAGRQYAHEIAFVFRRAAEVRRGLRSLGGELGRPRDRGLVRG